MRTTPRFETGDERSAYRRGVELIHAKLHDLLRKQGLKPFQLAVRGVLIRIGVEPNTELFRQQLETDEKGFIAVNSQQETSVPMVLQLAMSQIRLRRQSAAPPAPEQPRPKRLPRD